MPFLAVFILFARIPLIRSSFVPQKQMPLSSTKVLISQIPDGFLPFFPDHLLFIFPDHLISYLPTPLITFPLVNPKTFKFKIMVSLTHLRVVEPLFFFNFWES
jgi:hypothetical protein